MEVMVVEVIVVEVIVVEVSVILLVKVSLKRKQQAKRLGKFVKEEPFLGKIYTAMML